MATRRHTQCLRLLVLDIGHVTSRHLDLRLEVRQAVVVALLRVELLLLEDVAQSVVRERDLKP